MYGIEKTVHLSCTVREDSLHPRPCQIGDGMNHRPYKPATPRQRGLT